MSLASIQYIRVISTTSSSSSSPSTAAFRSNVTTIRSSQADGPLRRPSVATPPLSKPSIPTPSPSPTQPSLDVNVNANVNVITMEFQRQRAKELQEYFKQKKMEEVVNQGPFFGFIAKNEISNGRWAMFGFAVGMLTEYATGSDFVDQLKILLSNFGIVDLE
ncbi:hypothetical protein OSB04_025702 [Centaurea solstitialis]|uniref:One-helix protein n=1 Tax=Centaurea solstitialis TaxID=347529 RepID=A0AA38T0V4_9ASTR|nr:hypothetical protein OSB04_025702 [Centaurea solstitialis]